MNWHDQESVLHERFCTWVRPQCSRCRGTPSPAGKPPCELPHSPVVFQALCIFLLVALAGLLPAASVSAQEALALGVHAGFDGYYRPNSWVPVYVVAANEGSDIEGEIRASHSDSGDGIVYTQRAVLPTHSRKQFVLNIPIQYNTQEITVRLTEGDKVLTRETARVQPVDSRDLLYGVISDDPAALRYLAGLPPRNLRRVHVAHLSLQDLPTQATILTSLDTLILHNVDTATLSDGQRDALRGWVGLGGHLVICGGPNALLTASGLGDLLPVEIEGTETTRDVSALGAYAGTPFSADVPAVIALVSQVAPGARVLAGAPGRPLLVRRNLNQGRVDYLALDPDLEPMRTWIGNDNLWPKLTFSTPLTERLSSNLGWSNLYNAAANIPSLDVPSVFLVVGFLFFYVIIVGPLNLLVLKLLDKRTLAWVTVPVLILSFSCVAYVVGFVSRGRSVIISQVSIVQAQLGSKTAIVDSVTGLYSPSRRAYDVQLPDNVLVDYRTQSYYPMSGAGSGALTVEQGPPTILRQVEVDVGAMRSFAMNRVQPWSGIEGDLALTSGTGNTLRVQGTITNKSNSKIEGCVLLYHSQPIVIPDIAAGETRSLAVDFQGSASLPNYRLVDDMLGSTPLGRKDRRERERKSDILNSVLQSTSGASMPGFTTPTLIGWSAENPLLVDVVGRPDTTHATTLILVPLSATTEDSLASILPRHSMDWSNVGSGSTVSPYALHPGPMTEEFAFHLPSGIEGQDIERLFLHADALYPPPFGTPPTVWLKNNETNQWDAYAQLGWGSNELAKPQRFIDSKGIIGIRVDTNTIDSPLAVDLSATVRER
jgi:hypothetical protein